MTMATEARGKLDNADAQIADLRKQVEVLMRDRVTPAMTDFAGRAEAAINSVRGTVREQAQVATGRVRQKPLMAVMIAATAGWVVGRLMR